jgi:Ni2+-binding GTPase involved in maturation of urease and hydrogenase
MEKIPCIMIGGFLGSGKTSALLRLAAYLEAKGISTGLITNDQGVDLVDTGRARAAGAPVAEVTGGCFCCRFEELRSAAEQLAGENRLGAIVAEPVGSCTDLRATVAYPLRRLMESSYRVAPLSVMVDPVRCAQTLGLQPGTALSDKVVYIYRKQLEEADLIVINKIDSINAMVRGRLVQALKREFPRARVLEVSCRNGEGLQTWFDLLWTEEIGAAPMTEVDYDIYAEGEARLGWLNARISFTAAPPVVGNDLMKLFVDELQQRLSADGVEIAHAKVSVESGDPADFGSMSVVSTGSEPSFVWESKGLLGNGTLTVNLRAEADPDLLRRRLAEALSAMPGLAVCVDEIAAFRPGAPVPTHRFATISG